MDLEKRVAHVVDFGIMSYGDSLKLQEELRMKRKDGLIPDTILVGQIKPVISFGAIKLNNGFSQSFLGDVRLFFGNADIDTVFRYLSNLEIDFYDSSQNGNVTRGGGSTYIGPGQLVVYPVVDYFAITGGDNKLRYKDLMDEIIIDALRTLHIPAVSVRVADRLPVSPERRDRKDIWVEKEKPHKIAGKSVYFSGNIASHGFSLYMTRKSIEHFGKILVCGYTSDQLGVTSIEDELGKTISFDEVRRLTLDSLRRSFQYDSLIEKSLGELTTKDVIV